MRNKLESEFGQEERENIESRVILYFRRHGKKEKILDGQKDSEVPLTKEGREQAVALGKGLNAHPEMTVAFGSPRKRAQEVAARAMLANEKSISVDMTLDELKSEIAKEIGHSQKILTDKRLDFYEQPGKLKELTDKAYAEKRTAEFMINESDALAKETGDEVSSTYTRLAAQVAELVKKYIEIGNNFHKIVEEDPEKYKQFQNQMERFMGTHNTVSDSFVAKLIEKHKGVKERERFIQVLGPLGFKEAEGFQIEITNRGALQEIKLNVKVGDQVWDLIVDPTLLDEMIKDREEFDLDVSKVI